MIAKWAKVVKFSGARQLTPLRPLLPYSFIACIMPDIPKTKILTYLCYEALFGEIDKAGIALPLTYLKDSGNIDAVIMEYVETLNPVETIQFSSFLNMICQTSKSEEVIKLVRRELRATKLNRESQRASFFTVITCCT